MTKHLLLIALIVFSVGATLAQDEDNTDNTRLSHVVCDWGLLTIEHTPEPDFILIESPENYSGVESTEFTLAGTGGGLFEGNVIVDVLVDDEVIFSEATVLEAEEVGGEGEWSLDISLTDLDETTPITIHAFSTSPQDNAIIAMDTIHLNTNSEFGLPFVEITQPFGSNLVSSMPLLIEGRAGGIFENNLIVEVYDFETNELLVETFATVETEEFAGIGDFLVEIDLDVEPGTQLMVSVYQPAIAEDEVVTIDDTQFALVNPSEDTFERTVTIRSDDPLNSSDDVCAEIAASESKGTD